MIDIEQAKLDPPSVFARPGDVLQEAKLSREEKILILRRWEYDARELEVAEEENMLGSDPDILDEILKALHELNAWVDLEHEPPTKQGGE